MANEAIGLVRGSGSSSDRRIRSLKSGTGDGGTLHQRQEDSVHRDRERGPEDISNVKVVKKWMYFQFELSV